MSSLSLALSLAMGTAQCFIVADDHQQCVVKWKLIIDLFVKDVQDFNSMLYQLTSRQILSERLVLTCVAQMGTTTINPWNEHSFR